MNERQLSDRIGNVDDRLVQQVAQMTDHRQARRKRRLHQFAAAAAVAALMICSFCIGALAFSKEIYLEKKQEILEIGAFGISLILPDEWAGKYGCDRLAGGDICVYSLAAREDGTDHAGALFWVERVDGQYPMDFSYAQPGYTIAAGDRDTYRLVLASDVQYDSSDSRIAGEYEALYDSIPQIRILLSDWLTEHSVNPANWVSGTVSVEYLGEMTSDGQEVVQTVVLDEAASAVAARILQSQEYRDENASFFCDLVFFAEGRPYHMNSQTGQILSVGGLSAALSAEDLQSLLSLLEME